MKTPRFLKTLAAAAVIIPLAACGGGGGTDAGGGGGDASGTITYWLWDANQLPAYQACADEFNTANEGLEVVVEQYGWDDYWQKVTNGFVAGTAPDVFTDHVARYAEFVSTNQLLAIDDVPMGEYQDGLAELWVGPDGKRYGMPKDFDTIALFYNKGMTDEAGVTDQLASLEWNPEDGGTYEEVIAHLTVDGAGVRGDEPGFNKDDVEVYGLGMDGFSGGAWGQTQWSMYTGTTGWTHTDENPWGTTFNYDDERFQDTWTWLLSMVDKGYVPPLKAVTGQGSGDIFAAGKYATLMQGSWMTKAIFDSPNIEVGLAPTPIGPEGNRSSAYNGLADSIWVGTDNPEGAKKWVEYLGGEECQTTVGEHAVVFPANPAATEVAQKAFADEGIDVSPFLVHIEEGTTHLLPIIDKAAQVEGIMTPALDAVYAGSAPVTSMNEINQQLEALYAG